jgi:hypothetical protein
MATEAIKSTAITGLDATPPLRGTTGIGTTYTPKKTHAVATVTTGVEAASTYRMVRLRSTAKVKHVWMFLNAAGTTITGDVGIYYSDSPNPDGTTSLNSAGAVINADHFAAAVALAAIVLVPLDVTREATTYLGADMDLPLWNTAASGLTVDPGGFIDIVFTLTSTAGSAAVLNMEVEWAD